MEKLSVSLAAWFSPGFIRLTVVALIDSWDLLPGNRVSCPRPAGGSGGTALLPGCRSAAFVFPSVHKQVF